MKQNIKTTSIGIFPIYIILIIAKALGWVKIGWGWVITFPLWFSVLFASWVVLITFLFGIFSIIINKGKRI